MRYAVKLYPRAYRDLDGIYSYIALNLTEPETADKMIAALEEAIYSLEQSPNAAVSGAREFMPIRITVRYSSRITPSFTGGIRTNKRCIL